MMRQSMETLKIQERNLCDEHSICTKTLLKSIPDSNHQNLIPDRLYQIEAQESQKESI